MSVKTQTVHKSPLPLSIPGQGYHAAVVLDGALHALGGFDGISQTSLSSVACFWIDVVFWFGVFGFYTAWRSVLH